MDRPKREASPDDIVRALRLLGNFELAAEIQRHGLPAEKNYRENRRIPAKPAKPATFRRKITRAEVERAKDILSTMGNSETDIRWADGILQTKRREQLGTLKVFQRRDLVSVSYGSKQGYVLLRDWMFENDYEEWMFVIRPEIETPTEIKGVEVRVMKTHIREI